MAKPRTAVLGIGATGAVMAAALLQTDPETLLIEASPERAQAIKQNGIQISGAITYDTPVKRMANSVGELAGDLPEVIILATKTFHLPRVLDDLAQVWQPGVRLVSAHNGLGTEDLIVERFGPETALRMSLNFGVDMQAPGKVAAAFFNRPNPMGCMDPASQEVAQALADRFTQGGLETEMVPDIKLLVWKKMIMKCTMANICAVTDRTIRDCLADPPTRHIADHCFEEILAVAKAQGYDLGEDYMEQAMAYLEKVGVHKDSMCVDMANQQPTEIEFLGGKVCEYAAEAGLDVPYYLVMTNLVRALENNYLKK